MAKLADLTGHTARVLHMAQVKSCFKLLLFSALSLQLINREVHASIFQSPDGHTIVSAAADETLQ